MLIRHSTEPVSPHRSGMPGKSTSAVSDWAHHTPTIPVRATKTATPLARPNSLASAPLPRHKSRVHFIFTAYF